MFFSGERAMELLRAQTDLGVRAPGTDGQRALLALLRAELRNLGLTPAEQRWTVRCSRAPGGEAELTNVLVRLPGRDRRRTTLLGTHHDTRWIADREPDAAGKGRPILGANDGGSGTAVLLELARVLVADPPRHDVVLAFFDGEDLGDLDGHPFAVGSRHFVELLDAADGGEGAAGGEAWRPDEVIALDMVGGEGMRLNLEGNSLSASTRGRELFIRLFRLGRRAGHEAFFEGELRWIWSDHGPFLEAGLPAVLLIDIDYPWWHTQGDRPEHCAPASLAAVGEVLAAHLRGELDEP